MMNLDLEAIPLKDLKRLQKDIGAAIADYSQREKRKKLAEVEAFLREKGLDRSDLAELVGSAMKPGKKSKGVPKYVNPNDSSQTWTGRGRKPDWLHAHLAAGGTVESLAI